MTNPEYLLYRAFSIAEDNCKTASWQKEIRAGYEMSRLRRAFAPNLMERIGDDGARRRHLRERLGKQAFAVLVVRYCDQWDRVNHAWQKLVHDLRRDERLPEPLRKNPVLLQTLMLWHLRHKDLRKAKHPFRGSSEATTRRWHSQCEHLAQECWINPAESAASEILQDTEESWNECGGE